MDENQYELISLIEKCNTFISDVPYNQLLDASIKRGSLTKQEALSLLVGAEIDWNKSIKTDKETLIEFKRFNGRNYEEWILCVWYESDR